MEDYSCTGGTGKTGSPEMICTWYRGLWACKMCPVTKIKGFPWRTASISKSKSDIKHPISKSERSINATLQLMKIKKCHKIKISATCLLDTAP